MTLETSGVCNDRLGSPSLSLGMVLWAWFILVWVAIIPPEAIMDVVVGSAIPYPEDLTSVESVNCNDNIVGIFISGAVVPGASTWVNCEVSSENHTDPPEY